MTADVRTEADGNRPLVLSHEMSKHRDGEKLCGVPEGGSMYEELIISALSKMEEEEEE